VLQFSGTTGGYNFGSNQPLTISGPLKVQNNANLVGINGISLGSTAAKATASNQGIFLQSNDAANVLYGVIYLTTDPTPGNRRLQISASESGVAPRAITLNEGGGNVGVGKPNPGAALDVLGPASTTALIVTGASGAKLYVDNGGSGSNFYDANAHNFRNAAASVTSMTMTGSVISIPGTLSVNGGNFNLMGVSCAVNVAYAGAGTAYGMAMRPNADSTIAILFVNAAGTTVGSINQTSTNTSYATTSDERLKEDLKTFDAGNIIDNTNVYDFAWKTTGERSYGVIAQQAVDVYPAAVTYAKEQDWWGVDYSKYVPVLLQELKALRARVAELEGRLSVGTRPT